MFEGLSTGLESYFLSMDWDELLKNLKKFKIMNLEYSTQTRNKVDSGCNVDVLVYLLERIGDKIGFEKDTEYSYELYMIFIYISLSHSIDKLPWLGLFHEVLQ